MKIFSNRSILSIFIYFLIFTPSVLHAKDKAIIIFDASGSMWGQIKGKTKIEAAREKIVQVIVKDWNEDIELGLIAYGHRKKGDCNDIEVLLPVSTPDSKKIVQITNDISPKGKTPISQSLRLAAKTLRYTEDTATVILVSDGEENCDADPCVVSKELEAKGIEFTAHTIGLDMKNNDKALKQMKCIADETGGLFLLAEDAASLGAALTKVKQKIEQSPVTSKVSLIAIDSSTDKMVIGAAEWSIINVSTEAIQTLKSDKAEIKADLNKGDYEVFVNVGGQSGDGKITITNNPEQRFIFQVGKVEGTKPFDVPSSVAAGELMKFSWNGPNINGDMIFIIEPNEPNNKYFRNDERRHMIDKGSPAVLTAPAKPGKYEIRYFSDGNGTVLSRMPLEVTQTKVKINIPTELPAGKVVNFSWIGPNSPGDMLFFADKSMENNLYPSSNSQRVETKDGKSGQLVTPAKPGDYEVRYYSYNNGQVLAKFHLKIVKSEVTFDAPRIASVGTILEVKWTGPNAPDDMLFIAKTSMEDNKYYSTDRQRSLTSSGSPAKLTVPATAGSYEIRYYSFNNGNVLARRALIVR